MNKPPIKSFMELIIEQASVTKLPRGRTIRGDEKKTNAKIFRFKPRMRVVK